MTLLTACAQPSASTAPRFESPARYSIPPASQNEAYCAWYGNTRDDILYFGSAAFWSSYRDHGNDARADLRRLGPQPIGRFDLAHERHLEPLQVGRTSSRSGVWDVLPDAEDGVWFTSLFEEFGRGSAQGAPVRIFSEAGEGLNELASGPENTILATRYWGPGFSSGAAVLIAPDGSIEAELPLSAPAGVQIAPKTPAFDPARRLVWLTTDRLVATPGDQATNPGPGGVHHPTLVLDLEGREVARIDAFEVHNLAFDREGRGYFAAVDESGLRLLVLPPSAAPRDLLDAPGIPLDAGFPAHLDYVQDLTIDDDGRVLLTRWSGLLHLVDPRAGAESVRSLQLPRYEDGGLYYSSARYRDRVCTTYCSDLSVVCADTADFE